MSFLLNIDRRIIWIIVVALTVLPFLVPIGLPIGVEKITRDYYNEIEALPPGAKVVINMDIEAGNVAQYAGQAIATLGRLFEKDLKIIQIVFYRADCAVIFENVVLAEVDQGDYEYGVDWVNMGFLEGREAAYLAFAGDFMYPVNDHYGNSLEDLPLMEEMKSMDDVDLYITVAGLSQLAIRQFVIPYGMPMIVATGVQHLVSLKPDMDAGLIKGALGGIPGAAQYELLLGKPGKTIQKLDALSFIHMFIIVLVAGTNIAHYFYADKGRKA